MDFESKVLDSISDVLDTGAVAGFYEGTLFVEDAAPMTSVSIMEILTKEFPDTYVRVSLYNNKSSFAFDFGV